MKRIIFICCLLFGLSLAISAQLSVSANQVAPYEDDYSTKGSINLSITGGIEPYSVSWDNGASGAALDNLEPGNYGYTVIDKKGNTLSGTVQLNTYIKWTDAPGVSADENQVTKSVANGWGNAGTGSINLLKGGQDGFITFSAGSSVTSFAFGLDDADFSTTANYTDIGYAVLFDADAIAKIVVNGNIETTLGHANSGDVYKIQRTGASITFYKNGSLVGDAYTLAGSNDMRAEIAMYTHNGQVRNVRSSFFTQPLSALVGHGNLSEDQANSGYLSLSGVYGVPPYSYTWDGDEANAIYNLGEGQHHGIITDAAGNTVDVYEGVGHKAVYQQLNNINVSADGLKKITGTELANATVNSYLGGTDPGWVEFKIADNSQEFNLLLKEIDPDDPATQATPYVRHVETDLVITSAELMTITQAEYTRLNIVSDANYPESIVVKQQKFVDAGDVSETSITGTYGIICRDGKLYVLKDGSSIEKPVGLANGDVVRLDKSATTFAVSLNGGIVFSGTTNAGGGTSISLNMWDYNLLLYYLTHGGASPYPKGVTCTTTNRNWGGTTDYDGFSNVVGDSRKYLDDLGRETQSLSKNISKNTVIATQTLYDIFGRRILQTLPAPTFQATLCYVDNFLNNEVGAAYGTADFDVPNGSTNYYSVTPGERDAPKAVDASYKGGVGWYYSNNNNEEPFVATAATPYQRVEYDVTYPTDIVRTSKAGLGVNHGSGHETSQLTMKTAGELSYFFGFVNGWKVKDMEAHFTGYSPCSSIGNVVTQPMLDMEGTAIKKISTDENGSESVVFYDAMDNVIGSCLSGAVDGANQQVQTVVDYIDKDPNNIFQWVDVHLPEGCQGTLELEQSGNQILYDIINLKSGRLEYYLFGQAGSGSGGTGTKPLLSAGYYRIKVAAMPSSYSNLIKVKYSTNYYNFTANYYDQANRLRMTVPPKGMDYAGAALNGYIITSGHVSKKFETTDNFAGITFGGAPPNYYDEPQHWELGAGSGQHEMSLNIINPNNYYMQQFVVKFVGKTTSWSMSQFPDEQGGGEAYRTSEGPGLVSGSLLKLKYNLDATDEPYSARLPAQPFDVNDTTLPPGFNALSFGTLCTATVMPVVIKYQIVDGANTAITGVNYVTGYCTIVQCMGITNSYSRTWTFPQQQVFQLPSNVYTTNFVARLQVLDLYAVHNIAAYPYGVPWQLYTDITADFLSRSGPLPGIPAHTMTDVYEYNSWGELTICKKPDVGETDYIYGPDGSVRATQNSIQDMSGSTTNDRFSYVNYDDNGREIESGEYSRGISGASPDIKFKNYRQFVTDNTAPSMIIEANNNNAITDATRRNEINYTLYDAPDPNFASQTGLSPSLFTQEHLIGKVSSSYNDNQTAWFSYDELGRIKWKAVLYQNVTEDVTPGSSSIVKTFYYNYDYLGNVTEKHYQYHLPTSTVSDKMKQEFFYDQDKCLLKAQSTIYATTTPVTKTDAEYSYYLHGPLKRCQLAGNLQGVDYVYTVNGWLKNINSPEMDLVHDPGADGAPLMGNSSYADLYGQTLDYFNGDYERSNTKVQTFSQGFVAYRYNGAISSYRWQTNTPAAVAGTGFLHQAQQLVYSYDYDARNQMTRAQFGYVIQNDVNPTLGGLNTGPDIYFDESFRVNTSYDENGNITALSRLAYMGGPDGLFMDDLGYNYMSCSNKLNYVTDAIAATPIDPYTGVGFYSGQTANNYVYDAMGELITDQQNNKKYQYNSDGQITEVDDLMSNKIVQYKYDADGARIMKLSYDPNVQTNVIKTLYVRDAGGEVVSILQQPVASNLFSISEWDIEAGGRLASAYKVGNNVSYVYELDDHLGSTRTTFEEGQQSVISTYFGDHMKSADIKYFTDPNGSLVQFQPGNGWSSVYAPNKTSGVQSINLPVAPGDAINVSIQAKYAGTTLPNAALVIQLVNGANSIISSLNVPVTSASQNNSWVTLNGSLVNTLGGNAFFKVLVKNTSVQAADFDNITITFTQGGVRYPVQLDVNNYYPHGSDMPGLTYHSTQGGRYGYQGQYAENDKEIGELFFDLRNYDPLLGRFRTVDPYEQYFSPYLAMGNNHPNMIDATGGEASELLGAGTWVGAAIGAVVVPLIAYAIDKHDGKKDISGWGYAGLAAGGFLAGGIAGGIIENGGFDGAIILGLEFQNRTHSGGWYTHWAYGNIEVRWPAINFDIPSWVWRPVGSLTYLSGISTAITIPAQGKMRIVYNHAKIVNNTTVRYGIWRKSVTAAWNGTIDIGNRFSNGKLRLSINNTGGGPTDGATDQIFRQVRTSRRVSVKYPRIIFHR